MLEALPDRSKVAIRHILERNAVERPDKEGILFEDGEKWTYKEVLQEAYKSANALSERGIGRGQNVLLFLPNDQHYLRAWFGVASLGAVIVPVNTAYKGWMLRHICQDSEARYVIASPDLAERIKDLELNLKILEPAILAQGTNKEPKLDRPIEPWDIHAILYTSGTTGPSKGVIVPYLHSYMIFIHVVMRITEADTGLLDIPLFHAGGLGRAIALLSVGGRIALRKVFSASRCLDIVRETGATFTGLFSQMIDFLMSQPPKPNDADNSLRFISCAPMPHNYREFMTRFGIQEMITHFAMTEVPIVFINQSPVKDYKSCGRVREGVQVRLVDEHDIPVPIGEKGELIVRTDRPWEINAGYWNRPEETARAWRNGWFHTGDLFYCDEKGYYYFVDRTKDAVRRRGENISSFEVEREVVAYPGIREAACVAVPAEHGEDEVKVFVIPEEGHKFDPAALIKFLIPRMPYFMVPRYVEEAKEFQKTATFRTKKHELKAKGNSDFTWDREAAGIKVTR